MADGAGAGLATHVSHATCRCTRPCVLFALASSKTLASRCNSSAIAGACNVGWLCTRASESPRITHHRCQPLRSRAPTVKQQASTHSRSANEVPPAPPPLDKSAKVLGLVESQARAGVPRRGLRVVVRRVMKPAACSEGDAKVLIFEGNPDALVSPTRRPAKSCRREGRAGR